MGLEAKQDAVRGFMSLFQPGDIADVAINCRLFGDLRSSRAAILFPTSCYASKFLGGDFDIDAALGVCPACRLANKLA